MFKNRIMLKRTKGTMIILMLIIFIFCISFMSIASAQKKPEALTVMGGGVGGTWNIVGSMMAEIFMKNGVKSSVEIGYGGTNIIMLDRGEAELGISSSSLVPLAKRGEAPFDQKYENIAAICNVFESFSHIFAFEGINNIEDIKGKEIANQPPGSTNRIGLVITLGAHGLTEEDVNISGSSQSEDLALMKDRHVDACYIMVPPLSAVVSEIARSLPVKLLGFSEEAIERAMKINSGQFKKILPANSYPNQSKDILGLGEMCTLYVRKDMPDEEAYWITKTLAENIEDLKSYAPLKNLTVKNMSTVRGVELHPGAKKYYDEIANK